MRVNIYKDDLQALQSRIPEAPFVFWDSIKYPLEMDITVSLEDYIYEAWNEWRQRKLEYMNDRDMLIYIRDRTEGIHENLSAFICAWLCGALEELEDLIV